MDMKATLTMTVKQNDNIYTFTMPAGSPIGEAYNAAFEVLQNVLELSKDAVERAKPKSPEEVQAEVVK
jgi:hypothetical protein